MELLDALQGQVVRAERFYEDMFDWAGPDEVSSMVEDQALSMANCTEKNKPISRAANADV